jgi:membrane protease subunit HflC
MSKPAKTLLIVVLILIAIIVLSSTFYTVTERDQAVVLELGKPVRVVVEPGLYVKIPFIQSLMRYDKRLLEYDAAPTDIITNDKKNLRVDNYAKWRIKDPLLFLQTVRTEERAQARLDDIIYSDLRVELGRHDLIDIVATKRAQIMEDVTSRTDKKAREYGIEVRDVRIKRADLPVENERAIFERMQAERNREARRYRSEGAEEAAKIKADADKKKTIILAEAYEQEQKIRGEGDAESIRIYAEAFSKDPDFYGFLRSLEAYKRSLNQKTTVILSPDTEFFHVLRNSQE